MSGPAIIDVDFALMQQGVDAIKNTGKVMYEQLSQIKKDVQRLRGVWEGEASDAFDQRWQDVEKYAESAILNLARLGEILGNAKEIFNTAERQNLQMLG
ncbi:hypothetical protein TH66_07535 [Carbonactinospora thermoautotrophica]|uniref:ESAT-6-like protein n=1 Tax=Carbonactinospora thermoautotrophica TaxID=1469144 RepID=A0A132N3A6_9ACTN|nr:WXG100 family type VII secretion target [Carbonactinospora thermoautotrophica]KWX04430.1 hypothetical protein TH66_07535 [Carbonactinospora thermoautotrophica]KWX10171.1 hypothetical protein TR74_05225 [Carbonactinospora thermoautotrophica]